jgi:predicted permease
MSVTNLGDPRIEMVGVGSASLLRVLGVQPTLGRWFLPEEEGFTPGTGAQVAVLSHEMWASVLAADPNLLGRTLTLDERPFTIVGVLPPHFRLRWLGHPTTDDLDTGRKRVWVPVGATGGNMGGGPRWEAIGRLAAGVTPDAAFAETRSILQAEIDPAERSVRIVPRPDAETRGLASPLVLLFGATGLLLLIACANVAMLILGEMPGRRREITTRAALGAGPLRIARQLLTESIILGLLGSALGGGIAWATVRALVNMAPPIPRIDEVGIDLTVFFFATLLGTLAGLLFGLFPALVSARESVQGSLRPLRTMVTARGRRLQRTVLVSQVTLTVILLVTGGLLTRSYSRLLTVDPGFDAAYLVSVHLTLPQSRYPGGHEHPEGRQGRWAFYQQVLRNVRAIPGVASAGMTSGLPFPGKRVNLTTIRKARSDPESGRFMATGFQVGPGYLETLGVPLLVGRTFTEADNAEGNLVVVISETTARRYWPDESPVGSQVRHWVGTLTIVGVVGDVRRANLAAELEPTFYLPLGQVAEWVADPALLVRTREDPRRVISELREAIWSVERNVPVDQASTMTSFVARSANDVRFRTLLMGVFGIVAALLAATGIYGVTARAVAQGARELGIQMALGARPGALIGSAVRATGMSAGVGILLGLVLSLGAGGLLSGFLFGVEATDPLTYGAVSSLVLLVCLLASYLPARRITRLHPVDVLKAE